MRAALLSLALLACDKSGGDSGDPLAGLILVEEDPPDSPLAGLDEDWAERFALGDAAFEVAFRESQGLGPAYIRASCASCHVDDARGPGIVRKMTIPNDPAADAALLPHGHTERPYVAGGAVTPLLPPDDDRLLISVRSPPAVFGRGWMEAVSDQTLRDLAAAQAARGRVSGRVNEVPCDVANNPTSRFPTCTEGETVVGRFGLKARIPTLDAFTADALQGDMAITSPLRPTELPNPDGLTDDHKAGVDVDAETVNLIADYMRLIDLPSREDVDGIELFTEAGCADCHVPALPTRADWPLDAQAGVEAPLFSDLLLHDMGEAASDGLTDHGAGPQEWRTAPLLGLRHLRSYLHDGSAPTVEDAILAHGGEAAPSLEQFQSLSSADRATLLAFVESL
jgi:CxxC motif-containing protein (DUF1111 family)